MIPVIHSEFTLCKLRGVQDSYSKKWLLNLAVFEVSKIAKFWNFFTIFKENIHPFWLFFWKNSLNSNVLSTKILILYGRAMKIDKKLRNERNLNIGQKSKIKNKSTFMTWTWYIQNGRSRKPLVRFNWNSYNHPQISPT